MTRFTTRNLAALSLAAGTTLGAWTPACLGQTEQAKQSEQASSAAPRTNPATISLNFPGGTVADYIKAVQTQRAGKDYPVNVILSPGTERIPVRAVEYSMVTVDTAIRLLERLAERAPDQPGQLRLERIGVDSSSSTYAITQQSYAPPPEQELGVLSIAPLTRPTVDGVSRTDLAIKSDVVLSAVELALPTGEEPARVKYHEESQLLILQGSPRATNAVHQVIKTMIDDQRQRLGDAGRSQKEMIEANARVEKSRVRLATAEQTVALTKEKLDRLSKLAQQGTVSNGELQDQRSECARADDMVLMARADLREAEGLAALIRSKAAGAPTVASDELASLRKLVEDQAAQIKALTDELIALRKQQNAK